MNNRSAAVRSVALIFLLMNVLSAPASGSTAPGASGSAVKTISLANDIAGCTITIRDSILAGDSLELKPSARGGLGKKGGTDAGFALEIMWTGWQAPGKGNNAENPVVLGPRDFRFISDESRVLDGGGGEARLTFLSRASSLKLVVTYRLDPGAYYFRRKLALSDSTSQGHFLQFVSGTFALKERNATIVHRGGFGQPVAILSGSRGTFYGVEYPAADNTVTTASGGHLMISCRQEMGMRILADPVESSWAVFGITPDARVKYWFFEYVNRLRVAPLTPYALYNSWYDLRAPEMVKDSLQIMNETNVLRIVSLIRENMVRKHGIRLDAFVLDDGWDVYKSDWVLRKKEFPRGLKPIADSLAIMGTNLGVWFGPVGGYSHRAWRLEWMKDHGYETVNGQLCLAGTKYSKLFRERAAGFVENEGVRYFKWDGIQFSCSDPSHGHPVGIFSRRAVLESLIDKARAVRAGSPNVYLNVTSGTWLSPWWVQYANQIWMQGADYGYADVPSFSKRDAAMTYRDMVLYDDLTRKGYWFPIANLMTHGIIKGNLQRLGSAEELIEKFTDDVLLYFARGISMYELYISPDLLSDGEWNAIGKAMLWARDRFPILSRTAMIGGDPGKRQAYGYVHWKGDRGIVAVRNPWIDRSVLKMRLDEGDGLDAKASDLVLERVYPSRWISPRLYRSGEVAEIPLEGFETAVYELYPLRDVTRPLFAGVRFEELNLDGGRYGIRVIEGKPLLLNPRTASMLTVDGTARKSLGDVRESTPLPRPLSSSSVRQVGGGAAITVDIDPSVHAATVAVLVRPELSLTGKPLPKIAFRLDGKPVSTSGEAGAGVWEWYLTEASSGQHVLEMALPDTVMWRGTLSAWLLSTQEGGAREIVCTTVQPMLPSVMPPSPWPAGEVHLTHPIGDCAIGR